MRLINTNTLELKEFPDHSIPPYVIFSHVWGDEAEECHFQEFCSSANHTAETKRKNGYAKIVNFCLKCRESGYEWAWADTVCIDKANYDELNFAINSMFEWYQNSEMCFAYLEDTKVPERSPFGRDQHFLFLGRIRDCQWFKRGWTLQELIAPRTIRFFSREWKWFMSNYQAVDDISGITSLPKNVIYQLKDSTFTLQSYRSWLQYSPRSVLKWASRRTVRQTEDAAYSLLGLLNVKIDIHYGEGLKAFERLQTLLILQTGDPRCLLWENDEWASRKTDRIGLCPYLSPSISVFQGLRGHEVRAGEASQGWGVGDLDYRAGWDLSFCHEL
ncbi:hypothetical protein CABS01_08119 [Colletotrichum abscissum]|uniref:Heterokaryon incompatibility domain-containing protein n=1 Tax=Colletotrichum abscissum TaxID=1671311 RepID=A0A9P9X676_9PEZI|nr:uncharacterized protein CABS01_08119 [Colletotrichum abscissum]KAI3538376.1 hypothetical protein CABS02_11832 [Colletotrichum abscissum]KAK1508889.1 hypothetical protein CABS01_08119 [Colletotrichum abscissum]